MLTIDARAQIHRPAHETLAFLAEFTHMPLWNYYVRSVTQMTAGQPGVGTVFDQVRKTDRQQYAITEFMPSQQQVAVRTLPPARPLTLRFLVTAGEGSTYVTEAWELDRGLPGPLERLAQARVRAAVAKNLAVLTAPLETGEARLPDGRSVSYPVQAGVATAG
jgi:hypothetical protein